MVQHLL